jgi:hypothetical protein
MKTSILLVLAFFSINGHASLNLLEAECTGIYEDGEKVSINIHLPETYYCSEDENEKFKSVLVLQSTYGQDVIVGDLKEDQSDSLDAYNTITYSEMNEDQTKMLIELKYNYNGKATYKESYTYSTGQTDIEEISLKCNIIHYQMDC